MELKDQVCTLEQAKRLEELGIRQLGVFVWVPPFPVFNDELRLCTLKEFDNRLANSILSQDARNLVEWHNAYTASELGEMLPEGVEVEFDFPNEWVNDVYKIKKHHCTLNIWKIDDETKGWGVCYQRENIINIRIPHWPQGSFVAASEAQARAAMLIYLLENKLIP